MGPLGTPPWPLAYFRPWVTQDWQKYGGRYSSPLSIETVPSSIGGLVDALFARFTPRHRAKMAFLGHKSGHLYLKMGSSEGLFGVIFGIFLACQDHIAGHHSLAPG